MTVSAMTAQCKSAKAGFCFIVRDRPWLGWFRMGFELDLICRQPKFHLPALPDVFATETVWRLHTKN